MLYNVFIWFLDQENIGLDSQIMILHEVISEILPVSSRTMGLYFLRPLADADVYAERRRCTAAASMFQRKLRRASVSIEI